MTDQDMKWCSISLVIGEIQIKITRRDNFKLTRKIVTIMMIIIRENISIGDNEENLEFSYIGGRNIN